MYLIAKNEKYDHLIENPHDLISICHVDEVCKLITEYILSDKKQKLAYHTLSIEYIVNALTKNEKRDIDMWLLNVLDWYRRNEKNIVSSIADSFSIRGAIQSIEDGESAENSVYNDN